MAKLGDLPKVISSIGSNLQKHPETQGNPIPFGYAQGKPELALQLYMAGELSTPQEIIKFIVREASLRVGIT